MNNQKLSYEVQLKRAKEVKERYEDRWMGMSRVLAVGVGPVPGASAGVVITVHPECDYSTIPRMIDGIYIEIRVDWKIKIHKQGESK
jgi:hypothetical protein